MCESALERIDPERIRVGVSACLLGEAVRYDGRHKHDPVVAGHLAQRFELVPFCPEVALGMGVPRPPIRLVGDPASPRARGVEDPSRDVTAALAGHGERLGAAIGGLSGYVFKKGSPSCGVRGVPVYPAAGGEAAIGTGTGLYAAAIRRRRPLLPVADEDDLADAAWRARFVERVEVYHAWQCLRARGVSAAALADFHAAHAPRVDARDHGRLRRMEDLVAATRSRDPEALAEEYGAELMAALE